MLRIAEDMTLPCSKPSVISFQLRNFRDRTSLDLPGNLTAMGPLGFFGASLAADPPGPAASPAGFRWLYKHAADTSAAFGTLNLITVTMQPSQELFAPARITITSKNNAFNVTSFSF